MPSDYRASAHHGHINLEQQRTRAKELLTRLRDGGATDQRGLLERRARASKTLCLADALWLVARELGFTSWPKLKAHVDAVTFAAQHPRFDADDEASTQHWRCVNDISHSSRLAGFRGEFCLFTDPLCMGPVPDRSPSEVIKMRAEFFSNAFPTSDQLAGRRMGGMYDDYRKLARMADASRAVLWCDTDPCDQLFLIAALAGLKTPPPQLELIEVAQVPGVERLIGIGQLSPEVLAWLWSQRRPLASDALEMARAAWAAYRAPSPQALADLARQDSKPLPFLAPALRRQLQELPSLDDGLSMSERLVLQIIRDLDRPTQAAVFSELMSQRERLPFLSDGMFYALVRPLIDVPRPLIREFDLESNWPHRLLRLTGLGEEVLAGKSYWLDHATRERWVGGVHLMPGHPHWTVDNQLSPRWHP